MDFPLTGRMMPPPPTPVEVQKPVASMAVKTLLAAPLSVEEARSAAETALEPRERTAIIRALLAEPPASAAALNLATQIAKQAEAATLGYGAARGNVTPAEE
jgi:hypothetical protein